MRREYQYIVLGLGGLGSAAAYWLARRVGQDVLGLEQFELGHVRGESEDHSRIIRLSYHTPGYVALAKRAYESWRLVEAEAAASLIDTTGGLDLAPPNGAIPLAPYRDSLDAAGVPYQWLSAGEIMDRWPQFRLGDDVQGLFQEHGGLLKASLANAAHRRLAREHGATLIEAAPVTAIRTRGEEIDVATADATYRCRRLIIAAGPWSNQALRHLGLELPLQVTREQVTYYAAADLDRFRPNRFPVWIWMDDPCYYGLPVFGEPGVKVGQDVGGKVTTADGRDFEPDPEYSARVEVFLRQYLPSALGPARLVRTCLYTLTPDRDFVIDAVPGAPNVQVAIGAGHAFKFASVIGRILAELAIDRVTPSDLAPFRIDRPILRSTNPPVSYLV
ncbi:MAG: N-methyl-L-tryptophan oxidase [Gemmatimonadales bacterium]